MDSNGDGNQSQKTGSAPEEIEIHHDQMEDVYTQEAKRKTKEALNMVA